MASTRFAMSGRNAGAIEQALPINLEMAVPASTAVGDVVLINDLVVYAQTDRDSDGNSVVTLPCKHVQKFTVYGRGDGADSAVAIGEKLYADSADGQINKDSTNGKAFGYALGTVTSGSNSEILVGVGL